MKKLCSVLALAALALPVAVERHRLFVEIAGILTEEQLAQAGQLFEERMEKPGRFRRGQSRAGRHSRGRRGA